MIRRTLTGLALIVATLGLTAGPAAAHAGGSLPYCGHSVHRHWGTQVKTLAHTTDLRTGSHSHLIELRSWPIGSYRSVQWVSCSLSFVASR